METENIYQIIIKKIDKIALFLCCISILILIIAGALLLSISKPSVVNNYNIEKVETLVIQEKDDPIVYDKPFTNEKTSDIEIYRGYESKDIIYSDMGYATPIFKYIPIKINNWTVTKDIQKKLYETCKKYGVNYIQTLAIMYKEGARNNQYAVHHNENGSVDIGIMQFNSSNKDILFKVTKSTDIEWLKDIDVNLECSCYLIYRNERYLYEIESLYDSLVVYNAGLKTLRKIKSKNYSLQSPASLYAAKVISYMNELYSWYLNNEEVI